MTMIKFTETYETLKELLSPIADQGEWVDLNENQKQFRHNTGGILNWYPSTGTLNFQGKTEASHKLEKVVSDLLSSKASVQDEVKCEEIIAINKSEDEVNEQLQKQDFLGNKFTDSELIIGLVGAVGTELRKVIDVLKDRLQIFGYIPSEIRISQDVIPQLINIEHIGDDECERINGFMTAGNNARKQSGDNSILALGAAAKIWSGRPEEPSYKARNAYIINSLKHPEEISRLREIYSEGFYLIGVYSDEVRRINYLKNDKGISADDAAKLVARDQDEHLNYGQRTSDAFHMSDFFIHLDGNIDKMKNSLWRILDIIFGHPYKTPTFNEYAMFMAFSASLRSSDLSRQVGAVITKQYEIIATGANDCPKFGGGLYWPEYDEKKADIIDTKDGRDYMRQIDSNVIEKDKIIEDIVNQLECFSDPDQLRKALKNSKIKDITEYGRVVHAEMEALMCCARNNISSRGGTLYCTTFPCHNCAKHIIAAGIERVIYVEPYPKSKAAEFHTDSLSLGFTGDGTTVHFEPFVGVGPRRFFDIFSMNLGSGYTLKRKNHDGHILEWKPEEAKLRIQMLPCSYIDRELLATSLFNMSRKEIENEKS